MPQVRRWTKPSPCRHGHMFGEGEAKGSRSLGTAQAAQPWGHLLSPDELSQTALKEKLGPFSGTTACGLFQFTQKGRGSLGKPPTRQDRENGVFPVLLEDTHTLQNPTHGHPLDSLPQAARRNALSCSALLKAHHHHPCQQVPGRMGAARAASGAVSGPLLPLQTCSAGAVHRYRPLPCLGTASVHQLPAPPGKRHFHAERPSTQLPGKPCSFAMKERSYFNGGNVNRQSVVRGNWRLRPHCDMQEVGREPGQHSALAS